MLISSLNIVLRVIKRRISVGQDFDNIIKDYPRLTIEEIEILRNEVQSEPEINFTNK